jgi:anaerobic carbon-monoxide dehydrogenase iron sulfur subunit
LDSAKQSGRASRILFDAQRCTGCTSCEMACSGSHFSEYRTALAAIRVKADFEHRKFSVSVCHQCEYPSCVYACPVDALHIDEITGARYLEEEACIGCGACVDACPFTADQPVISLAEMEGKTVVVKCDLCRNEKDGPACVMTCPTRALGLFDPKGGAAHE